MEYRVRLNARQKACVHFDPSRLNDKLDNKMNRLTNGFVEKVGKVGVPATKEDIAKIFSQGRDNSLQTVPEDEIASIMPAKAPPSPPTEKELAERYKQKMELRVSIVALVFLVLFVWRS